MRKHFEILRNCYDTRHLLGAQSVSCVSYVPFCTNLCAVPLVCSNCATQEAMEHRNLTVFCRARKLPFRLADSPPQSCMSNCVQIR
jgi:hypothetical protein